METLEAGTKEKRAVRRRAYPRQWTADEFLDWLEPGIKAELIGGQVYMQSPVDVRHARILNIVDALLRRYIDDKELGELFREVVAVRFASREVFQPDLSYFTKEQVTRLLPGYCQFAPTLVVEALSPSTARRDMGVKFAAYERHGVAEYWILDPISGEHRFFAREGEMLEEFAQNSERIDSRNVPGFFLLREWLDPLNPPAAKTCLRQLLGGNA